MPDVAGQEGRRPMTALDPLSPAAAARDARDSPRGGHGGVARGRPFVPAPGVGGLGSSPREAVAARAAAIHAALRHGGHAPADSPARLRPADGGPPLGPDAYVPMKGTLSFGEFLKGLNPLHHVPVIGTLFRAATGETLPPPLRVLGGTLLGGPFGMMSSAVTAMLDVVMGNGSAPGRTSTATADAATAPLATRGPTAATAAVDRAALAQARAAYARHAAR